MITFSLTDEKASIAKRLLMKGVYQHHIAGLLGVNQGRISAIKRGRIFAHVPPATDAEVTAFVAAWLNNARNLSNRLMPPNQPQVAIVVAASAGAATVSVSVR